MSDHPDESSDNDRQRRLDALRGLMRQGLPRDEARATREDTAPQPAQPAQLALGALIGEEADRPATANAPRWRTPALIGVAALVVVAVVAAGVARWNTRAAGPLGAPSAPALSVRAFSLASAGGIYCASEPAWSPDGTRIAVFGQTNTPTNNCLPYDYQTALMVAGVTNAQSTNQASGYAAAIFDRDARHVTQRIALPMPSESALCQGDTACAIQNVSMQSLAWSPDGRSVGVFFTYERLTGQAGSGGQQSVQECGGLLIAQVGVSSAPRLLLAAATPQATNAAQFSGLPRFTWNLTTGTATSDEIPDALTGNTPPFTPSYQWAPNGQFVQMTGDTTPFAPAYQWSSGGQLVAASPSDSHAITPWSSGVVGQRRSASDPALYRASQWAWSTDGQSVTPNLQVSASLAIPGASRPASSGSSYAPAQTSAPYAAMSAAITASLDSPPGVALAQSPDGKLLASFACRADGAGQLTIRPTKSSDALAQANYTFPSTVYSLGCVGDIGSIVWSPDSSDIATTDEQDSQVTIWRVNLHS
ncbi:MAG TPA: hypothetical protein VE338_10600 [Ktedonobacterales bacterium]|jgi:hypothetical protein|nr:hypothetical protein [Ktedonobacterales bacterium]